MTSLNEIIPSIAVQSRAGSGFELLGWHQIGWNLQSWVISLTVPIIALLIAFVIIIIVSRWHASVTTVEKRKRDYVDQFNTARNRLKLSDSDIACITQLQGFASGEEPISIIERHELFERCVHAAINNAIRQSPLELDENVQAISALRKKIGLTIYPTDKQLTSTRAIPLGQVCSIFGPASNKEPIIKAAAITTVTERSMHLRFKRDETHPLDIAAGTMVRIAFSRANDGYYGAQIPVISGPTRDSIELGHTIDMKRNQLRRFVRVSTNTKIKCRMIKPASPQTPSIPTGHVIETDMHDLSGGGLSFTCKETLHAGDQVTLGFQLGDARIAGLQGTILRVGERTIKGQQVFLHHCKFTAIEVSDQEKIVKFTFERMRVLTTWNMKKFN